LPFYRESRQAGTIGVLQRNRDHVQGQTQNGPATGDQVSQIAEEAPAEKAGSEEALAEMMLLPPSRAGDLPPGAVSSAFPSASNGASAPDYGVFLKFHASGQFREPSARLLRRSSRVVKKTELRVFFFRAGNRPAE
jgi:hypothetical protein